jgi:hypothetical protein
MTTRQALLAATVLVLLALLIFEWFGLGLKELRDVAALILSVAGFVREGKTGAAKTGETQETLTATQAFRVQLNDGLFGGLTGGCLAGVIIAFYAAPPGGGAPLRAIGDIIFWSAVTGTVLGFLAKLFSTLFDHLSRESGRSALLFNEFTGALLGCLLTGIVLGGALGRYFGPRPDYLDPEKFLGAAVPGAIVIVLIMIVYDAGRISRALAPNILVALVTGAVVPIAGLAAAQVSGLSGWIEASFSSGDPSGYVLGGVLYGLLAGGILGTVLGMNLMFRRLRMA